jgi:outer membrane murein-binding lipoprotein Lpp
MLIRISLIVAVVAALAAGALNVFQIRDKINTLITERDEFHAKWDQTRNDLNNTRQELSKTKDDLTQTQQQLASTQTELTNAMVTAATQQKRADELADKLTKTTQERDDAQTQLAAYKATGFNPDQIAGLGKALDAVQEENSVLQRTVTRLTVKLNELIGSNYVVTLRADLKGKVVAVDPKWNFVVLNIGGDQGVLDDGEMLVSRAGRLVAKVVVRSVQKDRSIANVVPGWQLGDIVEGDEVTPAHPAS